MVHPIMVAQALGQLRILKVVGIEGLGELVWKRRNIHWPGIKLLT